MSAEYVIAVRTFERPALFAQKTLAMLTGQGLLDRLYVFVGSDIDAYKIHAPDLRYIQVPVGSHNAVKAICEYFPRGTPIVFVDDDLEAFRVYDPETDSFKTTGLGDILAEGFSHAPFSMGYLTNKMWLRKQARFRPSYGILGATMFGVLNEPEFIVTSHTHNEESLRTIQYLKAGRLPWVFPGVSFKTRYAVTPGGCTSSGDRADTLKVCHDVASQVEGWCSEIVKQPCGLYCWKWPAAATVKRKFRLLHPEAL